MNVVVAILFDEQQRVLITRRAPQKSHGGLWEFPGGKLELNETPEQALQREIKEEIGITVLNHQFLGTVIHHYEQQQITLLVFKVSHFAGVASCCEQQTDLCWVEVEQLKNYDMLAANDRIISFAKAQLQGEHGVANLQ